MTTQQIKCDSEGHRLFIKYYDLIEKQRGTGVSKFKWLNLSPVQKARWRVLAHEFGRDYEAPTK